MSQPLLQDRTAAKLPLDAQVKYLSIQAELDLLMQQIRSSQVKSDHKD